MIEIIKDDKVIHKSRSDRRALRVVLDHARRVGVQQVLCERQGFKGVITFYFGDKSQATTTFNNFSVAYRFVSSRRSWGMQETTQTPSYFAFDAIPLDAPQESLTERK